MRNQVNKKLTPKAVTVVISSSLLSTIKGSVVSVPDAFS